MRRILTVGSVAAALIAAAAGPSAAVNAEHSVVVDTVPTANTAHVCDNGLYDNRVLALAVVGQKVVAGGNFTKISDASDKCKNPIAQSFLFAFDRSTGAIDRNFFPQLNGEVDALVADPTSNAVFVGGTFSSINGSTSRKKLVKLSLANDATDGKVVTAFKANPNAQVLTLKAVGGTLYAGGSFSSIYSKTTVTRSRLAGLDPVTGAVRPAPNLTFAGTAYGRGSNNVRAIDITPAAGDGSRTMVVIGNFATVNGSDRNQMAQLTIGADGTASLGSWETDRTKASCSAQFYAAAQAIDIDPTGNYVVMVATGGFYPGRLCDTASRWEIAPNAGSGQQPTWVDYTGGDSEWSVAVTGPAVYTGGHQRWMNDYNHVNGAMAAGPGGIAHYGIAALDPENGMPLSWNAGRDPRGLGVFALIATDDGVWLGSDTDTIKADCSYRERTITDPDGTQHITLPCNTGPFYRSRIAMFPTAGGHAPAYQYPHPLGDDLYVVNANGDLKRSPAFTGNQPVAPPLATPMSLPTPGGAVHGAFMVGNTVYYGAVDNNLYKVSFDGTQFGTPSVVDTFGLNTYTGSNGNGFPVSKISGMGYASGRMYYTVANVSGLFYRYFETESSQVGSQRFPIPGTSSWGVVKGLTVASDSSGTYLFYSSGTKLYKNKLVNGVPSFLVPTNAPVVDGASDWTSAGLFLSPSS